MEEIIKVLSVFFEKNFIPAVFAMVSTLITMLTLPSSFWMIERLGEDWFRLLLFGIYFLIIIFVLYANKKLFNKLSEKRYNNKKRKEEEKEIIESWKKAFDHKSKEELEIIKELIKNNNNPIEKPCYFYSDIHRFYTPVDNRTSGFGGSNTGDYQTDIFICSTKYRATETPDETRMVTLYKLKDNAFQAAKYLLETEGKLSVYDDFDKDD